MIDGMLIDTHCHLYSKEFAGEWEALMARAEAAGVQRFYMPAIDSSTHEEMLAVERQFPGKCLAMMGLHPCSVKADYESELSAVEDWLGRRSFAAVGEIGLDFYWDRTFESQQVTAFHRQIGWALDYKLPVVIHSREAMQECIEGIRKYQNGSLKGIFHCFSGTYESARAIIDLGFYLGIGGVLTYKKSGLAEVLAQLPLESLVLETDAPYLPPVPYRGKRNESSYLPLVAARLAEVKGVSLLDLARITTANAQKVFSV